MWIWKHKCTTAHCIPLLFYAVSQQNTENKITNVFNNLNNKHHLSISSVTRI